MLNQDAIDDDPSVTRDILYHIPLLESLQSLLRNSSIIEQVFNSIMFVVNSDAHIYMYTLIM